MSEKTINAKSAALLALEAKMIASGREVYSLEHYIPEVFSYIENVLSSETPERLLNRTELETFHALIRAYTGVERRTLADRRKQPNASDLENRRNDNRRWQGEAGPLSDA